MNNPITIFTGCMFSGKTSEAINLAESISNDILWFKVCDESDIFTHKLKDGSTKRRESITINNYTDCVNFFLNEKLADVIVIDEVSLADGLWIFDAIQEAQSMGYKVIVTCLNHYWQGHAPRILEALKLLDNQIKETNLAYCDCGKKARYTAKISGNFNEEIEVGGSDKYAPKCRKCFLAIRKIQKGKK